MCLAIYSRGDGDLLPTEWFNEAMRTNADGMGIVYIGDDGQFKVVKSLHRGDVIYGAYRYAHRAGKDVLIHFRKATHGSKSVENCHPFYNGTDEVYVHNGILSFDEQPDDVVDSALFGERILSFLPTDWRNLPDIVSMVESFIDWSKIVILRLDGDVTILNEHKGNWDKDKGLWFSNFTYKPVQQWRPKSYSDGAWESQSYGKKKKGKKKGKGKKQYPRIPMRESPNNLPVKYNDRRSVQDDHGFGYSNLWGIEWWNREDKANRNEEVQEVGREVRTQLQLSDEWESASDWEYVDGDDPFALCYPDGFDYQGYEVCTYCLPSEWVDAPNCYPIFFDAERGFKHYECCSCSVLITIGSPKRKTVAFDRDTLTLLPESIENLDEEGAYDA